MMLSDERILQLGKLQNLFIKLLFCQRTLEGYRADPEEILTRYKLPPETGNQLPDTTSKNFIAEANGRRAGVRRIIDGHFPRTLELLNRMANMPGAQIDHLNFENFLSSENFFSSNFGLPHPTGVGPGYESTSKFYFWFRDTYGTRLPTTDPELRKMLNSDFSNYLMEQVTGRAQDFYKRFTGGVYWPAIPGRIAPIFLISDQFYFFEIKDMAKIAQISTIGLTNLDDLEPVAWEFEPNIL